MNPIRQQHSALGTCRPHSADLRLAKCWIIGWMVVATLMAGSVASVSFSG
jgi:hypothetical protein